MRPGHVALSGTAFSEVQAGHLSACDVYDLGMFHIPRLDADVALKELRPVRLRGRPAPPPAAAALPEGAGVRQVHPGFHDAPPLSAPVCIAFCRLPMPQVCAALVRGAVF